MADMLYIPLDIEERASAMKTQALGYAMGLHEVIDHMLLLLREGREGAISVPHDELPFPQHDPVEEIEFMRGAALDMWIFFNGLLEGEQTNASLMKSFMAQKPDLPRRREEP